MDTSTREMRQSHSVSTEVITPSNTQKVLFEDFKISPPVLSALYGMGFKEPSPIQVGTLALALRGSDVIGQAQTGTGKTAAFGIPIIEKINPSDRKLQALIMAPTRELAIQVAEELNRIGKGKGIVSLPVYGGQAITIQLASLKRGVHIVVGTPGRLIDHLNRKTLRLQDVQTVVLDEADVMLDMGFIDDITTLLQQVPKERQTLLFSATLSEPILQIAKKYMNHPSEVRISKKNVTVEKIEQVYYETPHSQRFDTFCRVMDVNKPTLTLVFCDTKMNVDQLTARLIKAGYPSEAIHGDLSQLQRDKVMKKFRDGTIKILVATDVAARGLNVSAVSHVINYHIPKNTETYIHRIGRTGRAGKEGMAITLITPHENRDLKSIEAQSKAKIEKRAIPSDDEVRGSRLSQVQEQIETTLKKGAVKKYSPWLKELYSGFTPEEVASALLYLHDHVEPVVVTEKEESSRGFRSNTRRRDERSGSRYSSNRPAAGRERNSYARQASSDDNARTERSSYTTRPRASEKKEAVRGKEIYMMPVMTRSKRSKNKAY
ncbi:MAG: DEAD/DEAH box helicase [Nitrospirae bacterium]|nr:DEAD/DEAH box helicase [Nitrospirota bacterium]MBI3351316.1 DEAD/DEAH box helicase [Nitrospirota bacterium]